MHKQEFRSYGIDLVAFGDDESGLVIVKPYNLADIKIGNYWIRIDNLQAKAFCHENDSFNFQQGIRIATTRLLAQIRGRWEVEIHKERKTFNEFDKYVGIRKQRLRRDNASQN